jgi:soluble lytic murein transglycosylase-like protein
MRLPLHFAGLAALAVLATAPTWARACWEEAAQRYGISADLLYAVARVESNLNPQAVNRSHLQRTGSYDIGLMQINSGHLRTLSRHGIKEADLFDPCTNIRVGAWLLADSFSRRGATWDAVGAYNAACSQLKGEGLRRGPRPIRLAGVPPVTRATQRAVGQALGIDGDDIPALMSVRVSP